MTDLARVPFFVLDCTTLFVISPADVDGGLRRRFSPPTMENMSFFQLSFARLNTPVMSLTPPAPSNVVATSSQVSVPALEEVVPLPIELALLHAHDSEALGLADVLVSARSSGAIHQPNSPVDNRRRLDRR